MKQTQQNASQLDRLVQATITDPTHPLFGKTFPVSKAISPHSNTESLIIELPDGQHRIVSRSSTDLETLTDSGVSLKDLPQISIRTILPIARFVCCKHTTPGEGKNVNASGIGSARRTERRRPAERSASGIVAEAETRSSETTGEMLGQPDSPDEAAKDRRKGG